LSRDTTKQPSTISAKGITETISKNLNKATINTINILKKSTPFGKEEDEDDGEIRLVFRTTSIVPLEEEKKYNDPGSVHLFYIQAVYNVVKSNYPCDFETAIKLGGVQLQLTVGDINPQVHRAGCLLNSLHTYVPDHLTSKMKPEEWEYALFGEHQKHKGKDNHALKLSYLNIVRQWNHYGCTFFKARNVTQKEQNFFQSDFEGKVRIGVNQNGIHVVEPRLMKVITYPFDKLVDWNSQKQTFFMEIEDDTQRSKGLFSTLEKVGPLKSLVSSKKISTRQIYYKSSQAELINDLICDWLEEYYQEKEQKVAYQQGREKRSKKKSSIHVQPVLDDTI